MIHLSEVIRILNKHSDIAYEQDGEVHSLVVREKDFYKIAQEIIKQDKLNEKPNIIEV